MEQSKEEGEKVKALYYLYPGGPLCASPDSYNNSNHGKSDGKIVEVSDNNSNNPKLDRSRLKISNEYAIGFWWYRR